MYSRDPGILSGKDTHKGRKKEKRERKREKGEGGREGRSYVCEPTAYTSKFHTQKKQRIKCW